MIEKFDRQSNPVNNEELSGVKKMVSDLEEQGKKEDKGKEEGRLLRTRHSVREGGRKLEMMKPRLLGHTMLGTDADKNTPKSAKVQGNFNFDTTPGRVPDIEDRKKIGTFGAKTAIKSKNWVGRRSEDNQISDNSRSEDASVGDLISLVF